MGQLSVVIGILRCVMNGIGDQVSMCYTIASQFVCHYLPRMVAMSLEQAPEEAFGGIAIPAALQIHIDHFAILVDRSPQILLSTLNLYEDLINVERVTKTRVTPPQTLCI